MAGLVPAIHVFKIRHHTLPLILRRSRSDRLEGSSSALWTLLRDGASRLLKDEVLSDEDVDPRHKAGDDTAGSGGA
jgi:hypothetical protein